MKLKAALAAAAITLSLTSCDHKELCYIHPHSTKLRVVYDWTEAPGFAPAGMCCFFYPLDADRSHTRFDFRGIEGGDIELTQGKYLVITYNNDSETITFGNTHDYASHIGYTREANILEPIYGNTMSKPNRVEGTEDERVVITPDMLVGCQVAEVEITEHGAKYIHDHLTAGRADDSEYSQTITLYPHDMLCHYSYEVRNVKNLKHVSKMSAAITGMSGQIALNDESLHTEPITLPLEAINQGDSLIVGDFYTFGHHEELTLPHRMAFYVIMDDGQKYSFTTGDNLDVTEQVHSAPNRRRVHLIIDRLDLPQPIENGSGFHPAVDDWGVVEEDIII